MPHHLAHALTLVAEQPPALADGQPLLAFCLDGLGYGEGGDHQLRGCELLWLDPGRSTISGQAAPIRWRRLACLRPFVLPGGERALREPRRAALGMLLSAAADGRLLEHPGAAACRSAFAPAEIHLLRAAVASGCNAPLASGGGRLFDALASLLALVQVASYEGEAGLRLQGLASRWQQEHGAGPAWPGAPLLPLRPAGGLPLGQLDWEPLLHHLLAAIAAAEPAGALALLLHQALAEALAATCREATGRAALGPVRCVALSGGCFQNRLLLETTAAALRRSGLQPLWPRQMPCNDGGLALGQLLALRCGLQEISGL